jgi:hypothetical protein
VLRPPVAQERVEQRPCGLVRITLKKAYTDGTIAVDMDPLSLLCRLATSVPPPRLQGPKAGVGRPRRRGRGSHEEDRRSLTTDGQHVGREHALTDGDVLEQHV